MRMATVRVFLSVAHVRAIQLLQMSVRSLGGTMSRQFARVSGEPRNAGCETVCEFAELQTMRLLRAELIEQGLRDLALGYDCTAIMAPRPTTVSPAPQGNTMTPDPPRSAPLTWNELTASC